MPPPITNEIVRRPISMKIFGIVILMLVLMFIVTLMSSINLHRMGQELNLLTDVYILLDQVLGDVRTQTLREVILIERVLHKKPGNLKAVKDVDSTTEALFKEAGDCEPDSLRPVLKKLKQKYPDRSEQGLRVYHVLRLCTNSRIEKANALVDQTLSMQQVKSNPDHVTLFATIKSELSNILPARAKFYASFEKYLERLYKNDTLSLGAMQEQLEENRLDVILRTSTISRALHAGTRKSSEQTKRLEIMTLWLGWSLTLVACMLGLIFARIITSGLVKPVLKLLSLTRAIRTGNLDIDIQIKTSDEIGLLADSFSHMLGELKQKEVIRKVFCKYVDPRIAQVLLIDQVPFAQGGERRLMSVFFSDLEGFTAICEGLTPTAAVRLLNQYFSLMAEAIRVRQGIIDKYIGDSVMAFWGPPFTSEAEHATLSCLAALEQQALLPSFQALLPEVLGIVKNLPVFRVRMGIATGDLTVGNIGSEDVRSYTVIGDTVNLASRLESVNKLYHTQILISEETRKLAVEAIEVREIDLICFVGKTAPVRVFELLGHKGNISEKTAELRTCYEHGLSLYREQKWEGALGAFNKCLAIYPEDGPSLLFIERIRRLVEQPPDNQWNGVWTLTEK